MLLQVCTAWLAQMIIGPVMAPMRPDMRMMQCMLFCRQSFMLVCADSILSENSVVVVPMVHGGLWPALKHVLPLLLLLLSFGLS